MIGALWFDVGERGVGIESRMILRDDSLRNKTGGEMMNSFFNLQNHIFVERSNEQ